MQKHQKYFAIIRFAIGTEKRMPDNMENIDWQDFFDFCCRQSIAGLVFGGLERSGTKVPPQVLFKWLGIVNIIKNKNLSVDKKVVLVTKFFRDRGYRSCILKGQANAMMYPKPELRSPGDIDIWVEGKTEDIIRMVQREAPSGHYSLHHVTMPVFKDVSVEVHYRPIFLDNWLLDKRFKSYLDGIADRQFAHSICLGENDALVGSLTDDFNALYQLLHMWHHLFSTRNNLKQLIDYYYLLKRGIGEEARKEIVALFYDLGVMKYARGIMWIQQEVFGLEPRYLLVEPDEKIGKVLLTETLSYGLKKKHTKRNVIIGRIADNAHLFRYFPSSVVINPVYLVWHQWWKWKMKRKLNKPANTSYGKVLDELQNLNTDM